MAPPASLMSASGSGCLEVSDWGESRTFMIARYETQTMSCDGFWWRAGTRRLRDEGQNAAAVGELRSDATETCDSPRRRGDHESVIADRIRDAVSTLHESHDIKGVSSAQNMLGTWVDVLHNARAPSRKLSELANGQAAMSREGHLNQASFRDRVCWVGDLAPKERVRS